MSDQEKDMESGAARGLGKVGLPWGDWAGLTPMHAPTARWQLLIVATGGSEEETEIVDAPEMRARGPGQVSEWAGSHMQRFISDLRSDSYIFSVSSTATTGGWGCRPRASSWR